MSPLTFESPYNPLVFYFSLCWFHFLDWVQWQAKGFQFSLVLPLLKCLYGIHNCAVNHHSKVHCNVERYETQEKVAKVVAVTCLLHEIREHEQAPSKYQQDELVENLNPVEDPSPHRLH